MGIQHLLLTIAHDMESLDSIIARTGTGNPQIKRRRTLRHEKFLDWFWYSLIWTHWLQSDSIIADIRDAVNLSWPITIQAQFSSKERFSGNKSVFYLGTEVFTDEEILDREGLEQQRKGQINNMCCRNRDNKHKLRRSKIWFYPRGI